MTYNKQQTTNNLQQKPRAGFWSKVVGRLSYVVGHQRKTRVLPGFTLIEMIVSVAIFMFVMVIAVGSLVSIVGAGRKAQSIEAVVDNLRFALDEVSRVVRTGTEFNCSENISVEGVQDCPSGGSQIAVINQYGAEDKIVFRFADDDACNVDGGTAFTSGCLMRSTDGGASFLPITSSEIEIDPAQSRFFVQGSASRSDGDTVQPMLVMTLSAKVTKGLSQPTELNLQTSVTQRVYDN